MDFIQFINALGALAQSFYQSVNIDDAIKQFLNDYIFKLENNLANDRKEKNRNLVRIMDIIKDENLSALVELVRKSIAPFFKAYTYPKTDIDFNTFMKFSMDFEIFPGACTKQFLVKLFNTLHNLQLTKPFKKERRCNCIDDELFTKGIAICAFEKDCDAVGITSEEKV